MRRVKKFNEKVTRKPRNANSVEAMRRDHVVRLSKEKSTRSKNLDLAVVAVNKKFGKGSLAPLVGGAVTRVPCLSTGWQELDDVITGEATATGKTVTGTGVGLPWGRIVEIYGPEASGKTTLALHLVRAAQEAGKTCAYLDVEHALDLAYMARLGVNLEELLSSQPDNAEAALETAVMLTKAGAVDMIVVDSIAALVTLSEDAKEVGAATMAGTARLMSQTLRKLTGYAAKNGVLVIFINQIRMKIGMVFGNPEVTTGGNALKFYASLRFDIRRTKTLKKGTRAIGQTSKIKLVKNKCAPPFREVFAKILYGQGIVEVVGEYDDGDDEKENADE